MNDRTDFAFAMGLTRDKPIPKLFDGSKVDMAGMTPTDARERMADELVQIADEMYTRPTLVRVCREAAALLRAPVEREALALLKRLEFSIYCRIGGREGEMCGVCCRFAREGHEADCWLGKGMARLASSPSAPEPSEEDVAREMAAMDATSAISARDSQEWCLGIVRAVNAARERARKL